MNSRILAAAVTGAALIASGTAMADFAVPPGHSAAPIERADRDGALSPAKRAEYMRKAQADYRTWQARISQWTADAKAKGADAGDEAKQHLDLAWSDVKDNWRVLEAAAPASWDRARAAYESAAQRLKKAWQNATRES